MARGSKSSKYSDLPLSVSGPLDCALGGAALLNTPSFNKGSAFTEEERDVFNLHGLLPENPQTLEQQAKRAYQQYVTRPNDLAKNTFMSSLREQNDVLFYRVCFIQFLRTTGSSYPVHHAPFPNAVSSYQDATVFMS